LQTIETINQLVQRTFADFPDSDSLGWKVEGQYQFISYSELAERVRHAALGLHGIGIVKGDRVALLSENRWEWAVTDLAALSLGAIVVPMFPSLPPQQVRYVLSDSGAKAVAVSTSDQLGKVLEVENSLPDLQRKIIFEAGTQTVEAVPLEEIMARGRERDPADRDFFESAWKSVTGDDLASIIYTSGTTGDPKGAMLSHNNFASNAQASAKVLEFSFNDRFLSFLPLSHVFERTAGHFLPFTVGASIAYTESLFTVARNLREAKPTILLSVPRLYESMQEKILESAARLPPTRKKIFLWSMDIARQVGRLKGQWTRLPLLLEAKHAAADTLVYQRIRESFGGRLRCFVSGGAPLPSSIGEFFCGLGIDILQGYGLTETSPVMTVNRPGSRRFDTVGLPVEGGEVRLAEDGEILCRGPLVMQGYYNKQEETSSVIDGEGWLHTGDIGVMEPDGHLKITDRKKNILVLANGKNVAPQPIESHLIQSPYISQILLTGDQQKAVAALIVPAFDAVKEALSGKGVDAPTPEAIVELREARQLIKSEIDRLSDHLADFERLKRFTLLPREFSMAEGELTPTLKIKRKVVLEHFREQVQQMAE